MSTRGKNTHLIGGSTLESIDVIRNHSKLFRGECTRLIEDFSKSCQRLEDDDSERLDHRVRDIHFVKEELDLKLEENILEIEQLIALQNRVMKAIESCEEPLRVTLLCIDERLSVTPAQWGNHSDFNIAKAEHEKRNSVSLRALVESLLAQTAVDMQKQFEATSAAFQFNIKQLKTVKSQMEEQLSKVLSEFASQQRNRDDLLVAVAENEHFLSLAQARLDLRQQRPRKEQCHDPAQSQLLAEVDQLTCQIAKLHETVEQSEEQQRALVRCQLELQHNIEVKARLLYVDEVICGQLRKPIVIHNF
ncbi:tektin-1 isoform X2 [Phyllopteryx taeniolatus]|uniref:tektin-1 isoform X2 n=1 Tax=Phyllopteryx taeniolatus TaxID=161469 RepID=UPI002AD4013A|nr:tektin-1 isoform X2 [Phyllopteryx taeniolatus]